MSCVGFDDTDFAMKAEAKGSFENSPKSWTFCMTYGGFLHCLPLCAF